MKNMEVLFMFDMVPFRKNFNSLLPRSNYFDQMLNSFFSDDLMNLPNTGFSQNSFRVDVKENDSAVTIEADLPGVKKESIDLTYDNNYLTISACREDSKETKEENFMRRERFYGEFRRSFYLDNVDHEKIKASFDNGVLIINIPKESPQRLNKRIAID
jgi:HSP20 family protein